MEAITEQMGAYGPLVINAVKAIVVLILGWMAAGIVSGIVRRRVNATPRIDPTLGYFMASLVKWAILLMVLVAVLGLFGIEATSLVAVLGAATLAIGLALQGTLSDLAAGFMLILFRPYRLGQYVDIGGTTGTVTDLNLFMTELVTPDNVQIIVPNGQAWGSIIINYSHHDKRRVDMVFGIDYGDDADAAMEIILAEARADARVHDDPEPWVRVTNLGDSSVDLTTRLWVNAADYWEVKFALTKAVKEAFDAKGISIPYPHSVEIQKAG
ncbi:mechanosensitive ion channel [Lutimaribacter sp. EGI FJ00015]|uniref:Mechanosensitive ion channel n=1 Tax=Lutimaribacter degradans TaxID=2945989 RepID=A0ACC5ZYS7_9RHOB|nr:mechanosensitive ion channel domain-containing protein [Lutimaribacter sp. EGI FJ00013]MCM2562514.1 mechanosensitive ion channel [Lutimaribacter sp. EGI FJ00013]MCO0613671.1 mechanosensitive ion channel [Lutimaribacter sp. EGI FJ00015]MCO0636846.1 mechanosensitive ion channel [Lutimaribacter sp. EGI FJ00014]